MVLLKRRKNKKIILAIAGSVRSKNMTSKILKLAVDHLKGWEDGDVVIISPTLKMLVLPGQKINHDVIKLRKLAKKADAIILATPEYNGSYSSVIKLIIENLEHPHLFKGKPIALIGVGIGQIGAIKAIEHLSSICQHIGAIVLPGAVSVAHVDNIFDAKGVCKDENVKNRLQRLVEQIVNFIK